MKTNDLFKKNLVCDPEKIRQWFTVFKGIDKHMDFGMQIDTENRNYWNQYVLYDELLMFLTHLTSNYVGLNQSVERCKDKLAYFLPKKAFKERINTVIKSYKNKDILEKLSILGNNKVVGQSGVVVDLFEIMGIDDVKLSKDYWILWIHHSIIPYLCGPTALVILNFSGIIPFIPGELLSLEEMVEERKKAGLNIPHMMKVLSSKEIMEFRESV